MTRTAVLAPQDSAWSALLRQGFSAAELASHPELLAWTAERNGLPGFRALAAGRALEVPHPDVKASVIAEVQQSAARHEAALRLTQADLRATTHGLREPAVQSTLAGLPVVGARLDIVPEGRAFSPELSGRVQLTTHAGRFAKGAWSFTYEQGAASLDGRILASGSAIHELKTEFDELARRDWSVRLAFSPAGDVPGLVSFLRHDEDVLASTRESFTLETYRHDGNRVSLDDLLSRVEAAQVKRAVVHELRRVAPRLPTRQVEELCTSSFALYREGQSLRLVVLIPAQAYGRGPADARGAEVTFDVSGSAALRAALGR